MCQRICFCTSCSCKAECLQGTKYFKYKDDHWPSQPFNACCGSCLLWHLLDSNYTSTSCRQELKLHVFFFFLSSTLWMTHKCIMSNIREWLLKLQGHDVTAGNLLTEALLVSLWWGCAAASPDATAGFDALNRYLGTCWESRAKIVSVIGGLITFSQYCKYCMCLNAYSGQQH